MISVTKTELLMTVTFTCKDNEISKAIDNCRLLKLKCDSMTIDEQGVTVVASRITSQKEFIEAIKTVGEANDS